MKAEEYRNLLLTHWRLVVVCIVAGALGALIVSGLQTPAYQSKAIVEVVLSSAHPDTANILFGDQLITAEEQLAASQAVLGRVVTLHPGLTTAQLRKELTLSAPGTLMLEVSVLDRDPQRAAALANDIANALVAEQAADAEQLAQQSLQQVQAQLDSLQQQLDAKTAELSQLPSAPSAASQAAVLRGQIANLQQQYSQQVLVQSQLQLMVAESASFLQVVDPATPSSSPARPRLDLNVGFGLVAGFLLGLIAILLAGFSRTGAGSFLLAWRPRAAASARERVGQADAAQPVVVEKTSKVGEGETPDSYAPRVTASGLAGESACGEVARSSHDG